MLRRRRNGCRRTFFLTFAAIVVSDLSPTSNASGHVIGGPAPSLAAEERRRILTEFAGPPFDPTLARRERLHELFEATADLYPGEIALMCGEERMTYGELEQKANQLARHLRRLGAGRGECVAFLLPRSEDVYVALLAVLKAGAAYVPLDPDYPADRIGFILADCGAGVVVTTVGLAEKCAGFAGVIVGLEACQREISAEPDTRLGTGESWEPDDLCYVIYTSGTTGRPKGVQIEHRSACNLVRAEGRLFQVRPADRVYQGFSIAFDASVEEVWLAFHAGAALVVGTREMVQAGPALSRLLTEAGVTVFSCVPTLLAMMSEEVPGMRLLILGGEACPADLVTRWARPGRRMVNTYGPTEGTVIATSGDCDPQKPVTIGRPVPNYSAYILDERMEPVAVGVAGELHLGGVGIARGYVGRPELTAEKFVRNPFVAAGDVYGRLYKTGDLARWRPDGEIEFLGRADGQVKLRGFRVELAEIESVLLQDPGVQAAAVTVREEVAGIQQLIGYIVPRAGGEVNEGRVKAALRERLPAYMVPGLIEVLAALPTLPSGKVDRKALPVPRPRATTPAAEHDGPRSAVERKIAAVWETLFTPARVSLHEHFFLELGGHSLLAARMVSELRKDPELQGVSMLDVYEHPTVAALATKLEADARGRDARAGTGADAGGDAGNGAPQGGQTRPAFRQVTTGQHARCGLMQFLSLYFVLGFFSVQWLAPFLTYTWMVEDEYERWEAVLGAVVFVVALFPLMLAASIVIKWLVIGRYRAGSYPLWGSYYFRFWFVNSIQSAIPVDYLAGTPLLNIYLRLMGAKIGRYVHIATDGFAIYDLLTLGDRTSIGIDASLTGYHVSDGMLHIGAVTVGKDGFVGTRAVLRGNTRLGDGAALEELSLLPAGGVIPAGERWSGSPSRRVGTVTAAGVEEFAPVSAGRRWLFTLLHALGVVLFPACVLAAIFPGIILMNHLNYLDDYYTYLVLSPLVGMSFVVFLCLEIAAFKWLLLGRVKPGRYPVFSSFYLRKWFVDQLLDLSLDFLGPLYATVYLPPWYRLLGAKLGRNTEISTASFISPDLLAIGDDSFVADAVSLGAARIERGWITVAGTRIGKRTFVGNSALLPPGTTLGDDVLIGCLSAPPANPADALRTGSAWLGSPALFLPQRQVSTGFALDTTFKPGRKLRFQRATIEFFRVILPPTGYITLTSLLFSWIVLLQEDFYLHEMLLLFPFLYAGAGALSAGFVVVMKWLLVGRYRPCEKPLWNTFVWRNELVNALQEHLANNFIIGVLEGTPFICWFFRLMGAKIGRRVYLETTDMTEFDLVRIGDDATVNADCTLQTHLFEDRVMKMSTIKLGAKCCVGGNSLVLYDTRMEDGAVLDGLSLLMKGESLPAGTRWQGIPARTPA